MPYYFPDDLKECYRLIGKFKSPSNGKITYQEYFAPDEESMKATINMWRRELCFEVAIETFLCKDKKIVYMVASAEEVKKKILSDILVS